MCTPINKTLLVLSALALLSTSCGKEAQEIKKDEETENTPKEVTIENIVGSYLITKVEGSNSGQRSDITATWFGSYAGECAKDDVTEFKPDQSFIVRDGRIECDESTNDTGTWRLLSKTELKIDTDIAKIEELTGTTLRIVSPVYSSAQGDIIFTYTRQ